MERRGRERELNFVIQTTQTVKCNVFVSLSYVGGCKNIINFLFILINNYKQEKRETQLARSVLTVD